MASGILISIDYNLIVKYNKGAPFVLFCNYGSLEVGT